MLLDIAFRHRPSRVAVRRVAVDRRIALGGGKIRFVVEELLLLLLLLFGRRATSQYKRNERKGSDLFHE
jgi:hypothetical protein